MRANESRPTGAAPEIEAGEPITTDSTRSERFRAARVIDRRRVSRLLDQILECDAYPDVAEVYHLACAS